MKEYDTIIIGAGLAGVTLGKLLLEKKQSVLILEKKSLENKSKLCGGLITNKSYELLKLIYKKSLKSLALKKIKGFKIKNKELILEFNDLTFYSIFREDLDNFVLEEYIKSGGKIIDKTVYEKIDFKNKILYINKEKYKYKNLVGADGVFSQVRKDLTSKNQEKNFALEAYILKNNLPLQIDFIDNFKGYSWTIPNSKNTVLGIGDVSKNTNIKNDFIKYFNLDDTKNPIKGAFLPTGNDILLERKDTYLIGDAAGLISPITGESIYYALISAYNLSNNMNNGLYKSSMQEEIKRIKKDFIYKKFVYNTKLRNYLFARYNKKKFITNRINHFAKNIL